LTWDKREKEEASLTRAKEVVSIFSTWFTSFWSLGKYTLKRAWRQEVV